MKIEVNISTVMVLMRGIPFAALRAAVAAIPEQPGTGTAWLAQFRRVLEEAR